MQSIANSPQHVEMVDQIIDLLNQHAGFRATVSLRKKLEKNLRNIENSQFLSWLQTLQTQKDHNELSALVENLTNHETYFFRDLNQFKLIEEFVFDPYIRNPEQQQAPLRIWSAACATGEEAYSLAIAFFERCIKLGVASFKNNTLVFRKPIRLEVIGSDISRQAVRIANNAVYAKAGLASFRNMPEHYWKYFDAVSEKANNPHCQYFTPSAFIKSHVSFKQHNLMNSCEARAAKFDLTLCRNLLIYIDPSKQQRLQKNLCEHMKQNGLLVLSPVDSLHIKSQFNERWLDNAIAFEKI